VTWYVAAQVFKLDFRLSPQPVLSLTGLFYGHRTFSVTSVCEMGEINFNRSLLIPTYRSLVGCVYLYVEIVNPH